MALEEYRQDMETCCRCSACKFIPFENVKGFLNVNVCPSIGRYNFHAYSGGGRLSLGVAVLDKDLNISDKLLEVLYNCQMCGACDISCKYAMDMEVLEPINEMRIECVEQGRTLPVFEKMMGSLRKKGVMPAGANAGRKDWHEGLHVADYTKEKVDVIYHAGCRTRLDKQMRNVARSTVSLMQKAGAAVGIAGARESCCGGRAYEIGYKADFLKQAEKNMESIRASGARTLVTACAECYYAFKVLYDRFGLRGGLEVLHSTEYLARSIGEGEAGAGEAGRPHGYLSRSLPPGKARRAVRTLAREADPRAHTPLRSSKRIPEGYLRRLRTSQGCSQGYSGPEPHRNGQDQRVCVVLRRRWRRKGEQSGVRKLDGPGEDKGSRGHGGRGNSQRLPRM